MHKMVTPPKQSKASARSRLAWLVASVFCLASFSGIFALSVAPLANASVRFISINEKGNLHRTSSHGLHLDEAGYATGTIRGPLYLHLTISSTNRVTASLQVYPYKGFLGGYASAAYHVVGSYASFAGTISITQGNGRYLGAHGTGLTFSGTIQRINDSVTVHLSGRISVGR